jgi:hypothetical protein
MIPVFVRSALLTFLALIALSHSSFLHAETRVWLIGGGNTLENSQGQIEENVRWLQSVFGQQGVSVKTFYTDGGTEDHDVVYFAQAEERDPIWEPILRVYGSGLSYAQRTRRNSLSDIDGGTEKSELTNALIEDFQALNDDDSVLLVYNGHGDINTNDTRKNNLMLWQDSRLSIKELDELLDQTPTSVPVRFVLTQCFSGSFSSLIYENPYSDTLSEQARCGFLAESDRREAEGCDLGTNQTEFRDYTTYFFAALQQKTRLGKKIPFTEIDLDRSGHISFHEAHVYTLANAYSSDLSRSTSETYLDSWEPWYLRWNSFHKPESNNDYTYAANKVQSSHQLPRGGMSLLFERRELAQSEMNVTKALNDIKRSAKELQGKIRSRLDKSLNTTNLKNLNHRTAEDLAESIVATNEYRKLIELQDQIEQLNIHKLVAGRNYTQAEKLLRLLRLARLTESFEKYGSTESTINIERLRSCESGTLK